MTYICKICGSTSKYYDKVSRKIRIENREIRMVVIERYKCPVCKSIHRNLPKNVFPYKQYDARIIIGVLSGEITSDVLTYEDYPCEKTMIRWKSIGSELKKLIDIT